MKTAWTEDLRPKNLNDVIGNTYSIKKVGQLLETPKSFPPLLLNGTHGTGKTTTIKIIIKTLLGKNPSETNLKVVKGSKEGTIENLRGRITTWCENKSVFDPSTTKILVIHEGDDLTKKFQMAFRNDMENWVRYGIVILLDCNYKNRILKPIVDRFVVLNFHRVPRSEMVKLIKYVIQRKKVKITKEAVVLLLEISQGIPRKLINTMQLASGSGKYPITVDSLDILEEDFVEKIVKLVEAGKMTNAMDETFNVLNTSNFDTRDIILKIYQHYFNLKNSIPSIIKNKIIYETAEADYRMGQDVNQEIQLSRLYAIIHSLIHKTKKQVK